MADVWRAEAALAQGVVKEVALKLVRGEHQHQDEFVRMFVEEARLACRLSHANVVQVFEFDQVNGRHYLAMELVRGRHLGQVLERARTQGVRLGIPRAVHVAAEAAKALAYVHRQSEGGRPLGLVHRDVSPHNLLVSFEGEVKLADFGIARAMSLAGGTEPGTLKGKIAYMAPEQAAGRPVDARADLFSLGVILWEMCAGRRLFARESDAATLAAVLQGPPPSAPSEWNEEVPPEIDVLVLGALERDPERRIASAEELGARLSEVLLRVASSPQDWDLRTLMQRLWPEGEGRSAPSQAESTLVRLPPDPGPSVLDPPSAPDATAPTQTLVSPTGLRGRRAWVLGAVVAGVALVAGAGLWNGWSGRQARGGGPDAVPGAAPVPEAEDAAGTRTGSGVGDRAGLGAEGPGTGAGTPEARTETAAGSGPAAGTETEAGSGAAADASGGGAAIAPGVLYVNAVPWGRVAVDGRAAGETPLTLSLPAGWHRVRVVHPSFGARETLVEVRPGRRSSFTPTLTH